MGITLQNSLSGALAGGAVGDALGLAREGLSRDRQVRLFGPGLRYSFLFGRGMVSDDTEHACLAAAALIESGGDPARFSAGLARRLRWWLAALPAGAGLATLRACVRLWRFHPPSRSGVFSAGNGPAMRAPVIGAWCGADLAKLRALVAASTRLTHTDPKAEYGAFAAALAAAMAARKAPARVTPEEYLAALGEALGDEGAEMTALARRAAESAVSGESPADFVAKTLKLPRGVSGYMYHTVPAVLQVWFNWQHDYESALTEVVRCGGDTDTTAAILGGIIGAGVGPEGIPGRWRKGLRDWPWNFAYFEALAAAAASGGEAPRRPFFLLPLRNLFFAGVVLFHGFRRLLPPY